MRLPGRRGAAGCRHNRVMPAGTAVWRDQLSAEESTQLVRGAGVIEQPRPDVLVVGGGIVGVATAASWYLDGAGGLLGPEVHAWSDPESFVALARSSLEVWRQLEQTVPGTVGLTELNWIGVPPDSRATSPRPTPP